MFTYRLCPVCRSAQQVEDEHDFCLIALHTDPDPFQLVMSVLVFFSELVQYETFLVPILLSLGALVKQFMWWFR